MERKTVSDLEGSIVDGRYEEQKVRLRACPCRKVMYLVEGNLTARRLGKDAIESALASTVGISGLHVRHADSTDDAIRLLASMHRAIRGEVLRRWVETVGGEPASIPAASSSSSSSSSLRPTPWSMSAPRSGDGWSRWTRWLRGWLPPLALPRASSSLAPAPGSGSGSGPMQYAAFAREYSRGSSRRSLLQCWAAMLRQVPGCSAPRAEAVLARWPTPRALLRRVKQVGSAAVAAEVQALQSEGRAGSRRLGPALARALMAAVGHCEAAPCSGGDEGDVDHGQEEKREGESSCFAARSGSSSF